MELTTNMSVALSVPVIVMVLNLTAIKAPVVSRKLAHMLLGYVLLQIEPSPFIKVYVATVASLSVISSFVLPFKFGNFADFGIITYNVAVAIWVCYDFPIELLGPFFFADPLAALVGKAIPSRRWIWNKTVFGTLAAFVAALLTIKRMPNLLLHVLFAGLIALVEGITKKLDNLCVVLCLYFVYRYMEII